jgi:hypothetical protein
LVKSCPAVPASCAVHALAGVAKLSISASFPAAPARARDSAVPSRPSTSSSSRPSGGVDVENEWVRARSAVPSGRITRASRGKLM